MPLGDALKQSVDMLGVSLRRYNEASLGFPQLSAVDRDEAIGNLDDSFDGLLQRLVSAYDELHNSLMMNKWQDGLGLTVRIMRTARHHTAGSRFIGWNRAMHTHGHLLAANGASFLLTDYRSNGGAPIKSQYPVLLDDFYGTSPDSRWNENRDRYLNIVEATLSVENIRAEAAQRRIPDSQILVNALAVATAASRRVFVNLPSDDNRDELGKDARVYFDHFRQFTDYDLDVPVFHEFRVEL